MTRNHPGTFAVWCQCSAATAGYIACAKAKNVRKAAVIDCSVNWIFHWRLAMLTVAAASQARSPPQLILMYSAWLGRPTTSTNNANNPNINEREISVLSMEYLDKLAKSLRPFLLSRSGEVEVNGLLQQHRRELRQIEAQMTYRCAWAKRTDARA